jgi:signal transduction histidine kinase
VTSESPQPASFLSNTPARPWDRWIGSAIVLLSLLAFGLAVPFAGVPWPQIPAFIPAYGAALILNDLITAVLLISQFRQLRSPSVLILGAGYLFDAGIIAAHVLSFPDVFGPASLIGGNDQTAPWLYVIWHAVFPVFVIAYALIAHSAADRPLAPSRVDLASWAGVAVSVAVAGGFIWLTTAGSDHLPTLITGNDYTRTWHIFGRGRALWFITALAPFVLWYRTRARTVLDLWLLVVSITWLLDFMLSAAITTERYDFGWYAGRLYGLMAASFVLGALLVESGNLYGRLIRSIETLRGRADALAQAQEQLRHAQKMDAMGQLTGGVAHDFNNLLTVIVGNLDMIARHADDPERIRTLAAAAQRAAKRGGALTHQLLMFARRQLLRPQTVDANRLLLDFEGLIRRAVGETIQLELALHPALDRIRVDPIQFEAAMLNLVINARDAMPGGGRLVVRTGNEALDPAGAAAEPDAQPGAYAVIAVKDTGAGIPIALLGKVFEPFFTTKDVGKGSGLGLSQVYGFVKESGGHVRIDSAEGAGTTIELWLPRAAEAAPAAAHPPRAALAGD